MKITFTIPTDLKKLAHFLASLNSNSKYHIGYCGENENEIYQTLLSDFSVLESSNSFIVAYENKEIIGAIGHDIDEENKQAEVWGPYVKDPEMFQVIATQLWSKLSILNQKNIKKYSFFINKENTLVRQFVLDMNGIENGNYFILQASADNIDCEEEQEIIYYGPSYYDSFVNLHELSFPDTYSKADEIIRRINDHNHLLIYKDKDEGIKGYVYVEADPKHGEGSIEYVSVSPEYQKQGVGTKLVRAALNHLIFKDSLNEITLCVGAENQKAVHLYKALGFQVKHELTYFKREFPST